MKFRRINYILCILISFTLACGQSDSSDNSSESNDVKAKPAQTLEQAAKPLQLQKPAAGEPDKYGRMPGAAHYGHDHPIRDDENLGQSGNAQPATTIQPAQKAIQSGQPAQTGGPDRYGRMPGDPHYGHNHE